MRTPIGWSLAAFAAFLSFPAYGWDREIVIGVPILLFPVLALIVLGILFLLYLSRRKAGDEVRRVSMESARFAEVLSTAPDAHFRWDLSSEGEVQESFCSRRLALLLDLFGGTASGFDDVLGMFSAFSASRLQEAVDLLHRKGEAFEMELDLRDANRRVQVSGSRAVSAIGAPLADMLWVRDVTEGASAVHRLSMECQTLAAELASMNMVFDQAPVPLWFRSSELSPTRCNNAYARAVDALSPGIAVSGGKELVSSGQIREARLLAARARAAGTPRSDMFHVIMGGSRKLVEIVETPLKGEDGEVLTVGMALDRSREEELQKNLDRHSAANASILERLSSAVGILSPDMRLSFFNASFARLWRLDPEWLGEKPGYSAFLDVLRENRMYPELSDFRAYKEEQIKKYAALIEPMESFLHLPDGRTLKQLTAPHPFGGTFLLFDDVTDSLALQRSLKTSRAIHQETIDNLHEGVTIFASDGRLQLFNAVFGRIWGYDPEFLNTHPHFSDLLDQKRDLFQGIQDWETMRGEVLETFLLRRSQCGRFERGDGVTIDYSKAPLPDGSILITWLDISDSARMEIALRERNEALSEANKLKNEFIANACAEVNHPLAIIKNYADILKNGYFGPLGERQDDYVTGILSSARHLELTFSDILDLAAIEAGNMALSLNAIDIHAMLCSVLSLTQERVRKKRIDLCFDCAMDIGWMVVDERRIRQILFNLLSNAVSLTPSEGRVLFGARREGGGEKGREEIVFTVSDSGPGMSERERKAFLVARHSMLSEGVSLETIGLGMSLVYAFVKMHDGRIALSSQEGKGSCFVVSMPAGNV